MWDQTCTGADKHCVAACRYCQFYATEDSEPYTLCSFIGTPPPTSPPPAPTSPTPTVSKPPTPDVNECSKKEVTVEDEAAGIWSNAYCDSSLVWGMCVSFECRPCSFFVTKQSLKYPACVSGFIDSSPPSEDPVMASVRRGSASIDSAAASSSSFQIAIAVAAVAVGVVALFAALVNGAKQVLDTSHVTTSSIVAVESEREIGAL